MRIASDYHDYYDTALSYGADPNLFYRRKAVVAAFGVMALAFQPEAVAAQGGAA